MELIRAKKQKTWGWPAVVNFVLGGMSSGFYLLSSLLIILQSDALVSEREGFKLLAPALTCLGFLSLTVEAGHPLRSRYLLLHLRRSWMSREALTAAIFVPAAVLDWLAPHQVLWALAAVGAMGLMVSQGLIAYCGRGVLTWNVPRAPFFFLTSGFATGSGLLLLTVLRRPTVGGDAATAGLVCIGLDLAVWLSYLHGSRAPAFREATRALRRPASLTWSVGIGHVLPMLLLLPVAAGMGTGAGLWSIVAALAGLATMAGGVSQKAGLTLKAGYLRGIVLEWPQGDTQGVSSPSPLAVHRSKETH